MACHCPFLGGGGTTKVLQFRIRKEDMMLLPCLQFQPSPETRVSRFHVAELRRDLSRHFSARFFFSVVMSLES